jgi:formate/nitrite transporter FocA (FNT family)
MDHDAFLSPTMAERAELIGVKKAMMPASKSFILAVLAGAFIALGANFATVVTTGSRGTMPFGVTRLLGGLAFCLGLVLVIVSGAKLFTGNNLIIMAAANRKVSLCGTGSLSILETLSEQSRRQRLSSSANSIR